MRRNAKLSLDDLDPEVLDAARDVARRAGIPLQEWIATAVGPDVASKAPAAKASIDPVQGSETAKRPRAAAPRQSLTQRAASVPTRQARALTGRTGATVRSEEPVRREPLDQPVDQAADQPTEMRQPPIEPTVRPDASIGEMMRRLDALDRSMSESRQTSEDAAARAIERIEDRLTSVVEANAKPADAVIERLADIERKMGEMHTQIAKPRALGRRGRPLANEMREAVEKVRQRQRELDAADAPVAGYVEGEPSPAIAELQIEASRLRESLGALATGRDVGAIEQAMRTLAGDVQRAQEPSELAAISGPIELMRVQVDRLADEVADNVHARFAGEVERLASKVEDALQAQPASFADRDGLTTIFGELDEIRRQISTLAGPERIHGLAQGLQAISAQIAQLQGRADALSDKMDRVSANPVGELIGRLEDIGASLQRPQPQDGDFASIQSMLRTLAEKVDNVGSTGGSENLDALEKQIVALAGRLDQRAADPAVAGLERMMGDLLAQVSATRDDGAVEAAVERATRRAVADAVSPAPGGDGAVERLRADLAEMRARQSAADERIQATMGNLNVTLERLIERLGPADKARDILAEDARRPIDLLASVALPEAAVASVSADPMLREPVIRRSEAVVALEVGDVRLEEELLDPAMGRPARHRPSMSEAAPSGDIKASFIAAARRAALAAQADMDDPVAEVTLPKDRAPRMQIRSVASTSATGALIGRIREALEQRRRPLLLGLAAVVLALGATQVFTGSESGGAKVPPTIAANPPEAPPAKTAMAPVETARVADASRSEAASPEPEPVAAETAPADKPAIAPAPTPAPVATDPTTTQSIGEPGAGSSSSPAPTARLVPRVSGMEGFKSELAGLPASFAGLKQAVIDGDGTAIYELASRQADGRGMPRDLAVAAKLFEKLAGAGYAPAQFKIGSFYEKGSGVVRDLAQAKSWYIRAADQGNIRSMHNLAVIHAENPAASGKPDFVTAAGWFKRAAEYGVRDSQYNLAVLYARGLGVGQDLVQSYLWFSAAAAHGDEEAGRKREDVALKLAPKDLVTAKALADGFKAKASDTMVNEPVVAKVAPMSLMNAPPPGGAAPLGASGHDRAGARASGSGV